MRLANLACTAALLLSAVSVCLFGPSAAWAQTGITDQDFVVIEVPAAAAEPAALPYFVLGFAALKAQLGDLMGDPLGLEHPPSDGGADTVQFTSTGLAAWKLGELPKFTDGARTWTLSLPPPVSGGAALSPAVAGVSSSLVECIIRRESNGIPSAVNPRSGASGLGQFLPSTWLTTPQGKAGYSVFNAAANRAAVAWMLSVGRGREFVTIGGCR